MKKSFDDIHSKIDDINFESQVSSPDVCNFLILLRSPSLVRNFLGISNGYRQR